MAAKQAAAKVSLGTMFISVQLLDLIWPVLLLAGVEHFRINPGNTVVTPLDFYDYPFSHSLVMSLCWSLLFGIILFARNKGITAAIVAAAGVFSHWILDFITHRPDLPLYPGSTAFFGLGLWNSFAGTLIVELFMFGMGVAMYVKATTPESNKGKFGFWGLIAFLLIIYIMNLFGPPPPNEQAVAIAGNAGWLIVLWAYWVDRNRQMVTASD